MDAAGTYVTSLHYRRIRSEFDEHNHLFVVPSDGGTPRQLTKGKWSVGAGDCAAAAQEFDWTPDNKAIVFDGNQDAEAELKLKNVVPSRGRRRAARHAP